MNRQLQEEQFVLRMLKLQNISKSFPGVKALTAVSLEFRAGEVHALCGENGAGKSTLMNIIAGNIAADAGSLFWENQQLQQFNHQLARKLGIAIVYQERSLVDSLTVAENIYAGNLPRNRWGLTDKEQLYRQTNTLLKELEITSFDAATPVRNLSAAAQQMVEIAKALSQQPRLLILDEPTAAVTEKERDLLFRIMKQLKQKAVAMIYISHRMNEIRAIADRISVLKDGRFQGTVLPQEVTDAALIRMMIGRDLPSFESRIFSGNEVCLEVKGITGRNFRDISFLLHKGEVLGFAGLIGAGRTELGRAICGIDPIQQGTMELNKKPYWPAHARDAISEGLVYLTEERKALGIFPELSIAENMAVMAMQQRALRNEHPVKMGKTLFRHYQEKLAIKAASEHQPMVSLSGGNQQKVLLGRCLSVQPRILVVDEPTRGIDAGTKMEIYRLLREQADRGLSVLVISSELTELLLICDRIAVLKEGTLEGMLTREEASEEAILSLAYGKHSSASI